MLRNLLKSLALGLLCAATAAQAGSYTNTFNSGSSTNDVDFGGSLWDGATIAHTGSTAWIPTGGAGPIGGTTNGPVYAQANDGYLQITFAGAPCGTNFAASSYLCGAIVFPDFDSGEVVAGFTFECDLRMGNGNPAPADGFSINYVRDGDPVLTALAAGDTFPQMNNAVSPNGGQFRDNGSSGDLSLMEEGTQTGLAIGFDMWDSNDYTIPANPPAVGKWAPGFTHDQIGLDISVDDVLVIALEMPNGTTEGRNETPTGGTPNITDSNGNNAATDPTTIETGPYDGTGCPDGLAWCHFKVVLDPNTQTLSVWWKNVPLVTNAPVNYLPSPGRLLMAARVGGNEANIGVDNIVITTVPASHVLIGNAQATPIGASIQATASGKSVPDTNTIIFSVNGTVEIPSLVETSTNGVTTVAWWDTAATFPAGSTQTVQLVINDTLKNGPYTNAVPVVVPQYAALTKSMMVTNVDTTKPGFNVKAYQVTLNPFNSTYIITGTTPTLQTMENSVRRAEEELAGLLGANNASAATYAESGEINYCESNSVTEGLFNLNNGNPCNPFPGVPDSSTDEPQIDNTAYEFTTYIHFPEAGVYSLGFSSDDGFRMTAGNPANDCFNGVQICEFDGGRSGALTVGEVYVPEAGFYPFRTVYFNGNGEACAEWVGQELFPTATTNALLNATISPSALHCYSGTTSAGTYPAAVTFTDPVVNSGTYQPNWPMEVQITDGSAGAISGATLYLNGAQVSATTSKSGAVTKLEYTPATFLPSGSVNSLGVAYKDASGNSFSNALSFTVVTYTAIPASMALASSTVSAADTGFDVYTYKYEGFVDSASEYGLNNGVYMSELENHGFVGWPNAADLSVDWNFSGPGNTNHIESAVINYNGASGVEGGSEYSATGNMPGIAPQYWPTYNGTIVSDGNGGQNDYSVEIKTVIYLTNGLYTMVVNSDDGFSVSVGNPAEWRTMRMVLGEYDGGRGSGNTAFTFYITTAGYYPFTCLYYEGGGGNEVEWMMMSAYPANNLYILLNDSTATISSPSGSFYNPTFVCYQYPFGKTKGSPFVASYGPSMFRGYDQLKGTAHSTHTGYDAPVVANLADGDTAITTNSVYLWVNGAQVTPTISKSGSYTSVNYKPAANWTPNTTNTVSLVYLDRTNTWSFMVEDHPNATFFIEFEDFDSGGKGLPAASIMPYFGGAYAGLPATLNVDYFRTDSGNYPLYRLNNANSIANAAPLNPNAPMEEVMDLDRGVNEVQANYEVGYTGPNEWYNYTRTIPAGIYNAYAGIGNGGTRGTGANSRYAVLQLVSAAGTNNLGIFGVGTNGYATGNWYQYGGVGQGCSLVPLTDPNGNLISVTNPAAQTLTLRLWLPAAGTAATVSGLPTTLENGSGNFDFMLLTPAVSSAAPPSLSIHTVNGQAVIMYTGTLSSSPGIKGSVTWTDVPGASSPYTIPKGTPTTFYRAHN
jgi:hypothetical protein